MKTLKSIYKNKLGESYKIYSNSKENYIALEINCISFLIGLKDLKAFTNSLQTIINYYKDCTCAKEVENKWVVYKTKQTEIRMLLSFEQLYLLRDLLKGTNFKLSIKSLLKQYKIN